jgi:hypothetical protein
MGTLARFQDAFAAALVPGGGADTDPLVAGLVAQPAFAVYRNTVAKGCIDALQANFPAIVRLVGEEWFRAAAAVFAARELPRSPSLLNYGEGFPEFLARFEPAAKLPYLGAVALLDRLWTEAHGAADAPALAREDFARLDPESLGDARLVPHPAARWAWNPDLPAYTLWSRNRAEGEPGGEIAWQGEGALLTRPGGAVRWTAASRGACAFLHACARGETVDRALEAALAHDGHAHVARLLSDLIDAGAFCRIATPSDTPTDRSLP